ncbi:hypothetical protein D3C80_2224140 [compost metagenome]
MDNLLGKVAYTRADNEVLFSVPEDNDLLYSVTNLPVANTKWVINLTSPAPAPAPMEQLSLLAS